MKWKKYTIETTTEAVDFISEMLAENGIEGIEIEDSVPLTEQDYAEMFADILLMIETAKKQKSNPYDFILSIRSE